MGDIPGVIIARWPIVKVPGEIMPPGRECMAPGVDPKDRAASLEPVELLGLSISMPAMGSLGPLRLCLRWRFEDAAADLDKAAAPGPGVALGGAAAIGTTPLPPTAPLDDAVLPNWLVGVLPAVLAPDAALLGLSPSLTLPIVADGGVETVLLAAFAACALLVLTVAAAAAEIDSVEFLRDATAEFAPETPFLDRETVPPTGRLAPDPRLRFLMTSVFKLRGRTTP